MISQYIPWEQSSCYINKKYPYNRLYRSSDVFGLRSPKPSLGGLLWHVTNQSTEVLHLTCSKSRSQFRCRETYSLLYDYVYTHMDLHIVHMYAVCIYVYLYITISTALTIMLIIMMLVIITKYIIYYIILYYIIFPLKNRSTTSGICFRHFRSFRKKARPASSVSDWWQTQEGQVFRRWQWMVDQWNFPGL